MFSFSRKKSLLDQASQQRIVAAIKEAESKTSGELRVYMEPHCKYVDAIERAKEIFTNLGMEKTVERNAIIIYLALEDRQFALFGDKVIYEKAGGAAFWEKAAQKLSAHLKQNEITEGLCNCIAELGTALAINFPYDPSINKNELPDEIVFGK
ncbi:MAG: hypothetical protein K0Q79_1181 [Flavipsychrobacter sp.]|jgi:uncharacterized membrane protein|nr:hypothetical protein [Flavipsychrobacter sp.]